MENISKIIDDFKTKIFGISWNDEEKIFNKLQETLKENLLDVEKGYEEAYDIIKMLSNRIYLQEDEIKKYKEIIKNNGLDVD